MGPEYLAIFLIFGIPIVAILSAHHRKVLELKLKARGEAGVLAEIEKLRAELRELRDTTTRFDLSFDTALQRLESRIEHLERQSQPVAPARQHTTDRG